MKINITDIEIGTRKRKIDEIKVKNIADSFNNIGQLQPVTVLINDYKYLLVAGLHRIEAARSIGWTSIEATIFEGDKITAELAEIDENLMRNDLTVLEQGEHIQRRNEILEAMGQRREVGRYQNSNGVTVTPLKTTEDIAKEAGLSKNSVQKRAQIARDIVPEAKELIRDTPIADSTTQLLELARMEPEKQIEVAKQLSSKEMTIKDAEKEIRHKEIAAEREKLANAGASISKNEKWNVWQADISTWIAPHQYDFIITDPPYPKEYLPLWETLAIRAKEWLKPGGLLIAMSGQSYLNEIYAMMDKHLKYYWTSCYLTPGQPTPLRQRQVNTSWKPLLVYSNYEGYTGKTFGDVYTSPQPKKDNHEWEQSEEGMLAIIKQVCLPGQYILDPFCGSGTTGLAALEFGCLFDGIDIDIKSVNISKARLNDAETNR
ncbi:MAG TPA: DNA methyltransferase [Ruminococcus flavefaciens]|nr:DNA methyltransferase [Ruminococcus flavefaciens]